MTELISTCTTHYATCENNQMSAVNLHQMLCLAFNPQPFVEVHHTALATC